MICGSKQCCRMASDGMRCSRMYVPTGNIRARSVLRGRRNPQASLLSRTPDTSCAQGVLRRGSMPARNFFGSRSELSVAFESRSARKQKTPSRRPPTSAMMAVPGLENAVLWFQTFSTSVGGVMEGAPLPYYFAYFMAAGFGVPLSEDAMVVWVGASVFKGELEAARTAALLLTCWAGVVLSDLVTYSMGWALRFGAFSIFRERLLGNTAAKKATEVIQKWGSYVGVAERLTIGFRGPLALACGMTGVSVARFWKGVWLGSLITFPAQLALGYVLRSSSNVYMTALAIVAGPNALGHILGPIMAIAGWLLAVRSGGAKDSEEGAAAAES